MHPRLIRDRKLFVLRQRVVVLSRKSTYLRQGGCPALGDDRAIFAERICPEAQLLRLSLALPHPLEQVVPLDEDPLVAGARGGIRRVDLHQHQIDVVPPQGRRARDHEQIIRAEKHRCQAPDGVGQALRGTVDLHGLGDVGAARGIPRNHSDLDFQRSVRRVHFCHDARRGKNVVQDLPADKLNIGLSARGAQRGEKVDSLEKIGLALRIIADEERHSGVEFEVEALEVAVLEELQMAQPHIGIISTI